LFATVALPSAVWKFTVTGRLYAVERLTVKLSAVGPLDPSLTLAAGANVTVGCGPATTAQNVLHGSRCPRSRRHRR
jgi:hypothetical protein